MKKFLTILLSLISTICIAFSFGACAGNEVGEQGSGLNDGNNQTGSVAVSGEFCLLETAYRNGWLDEDDLKSIACCYNSAYKDNPYKGLYEEPSDELSEKIVNELKQAYLKQIVKDSSLAIDGVRVNKYYGNYKDNVVVKIYSDYMCIDPITDSEVYIGGVLFMYYWDAQTYVYHINREDEQDNREGNEEEAGQISGALWVEYVADIGICYNDGNRIRIWIAEQLY